MTLRAGGAFAAWCLLVVAVSLPARAAAQQPQVRVTIRPSGTVYLGEPFEYEVRVTGVRGAGEPRLPDVPEFRFTPHGQPMRRQMTTITNGRLTTRVVSVTWSYDALPLKPGRFTLPAPTVPVDGREVSGQPVQVEVVGPTPSKLFRLGAEVPADLYPLQRFSVRLIVDLRRLDPPWTEVSPVSARVQDELPLLRVPWFADDPGIDGLIADALPLNRWVRRDGSGFSINSVRGFSLLSEKVELTDDQGQPTTYWRYVFSRTFIARHPGSYELGRASLRGPLLKSVDGSRGTWERVYGLTEPVRVSVRPLPLDGRPDSWIGVIGDLDVRITPTDAAVGQPLTLTLTLSGTGALDDAFPPDLTTRPEITDAFRIYEPTSRRVRDGRLFTWALRARRAGSVEFPAIELSWFDPEQGRYVTGHTSPIELRIREGETLAASDLTGTSAASTASGPAGVAKPVTGSQANSPIATNLLVFRDESIHPRNWFAGWALLAGGGLAGWWLLGRLNSQTAAARTRTRQRLREADSRLQAGLKQLESSQPDDGIASLRRAVAIAVGAAEHSDDTGLTTEEIVIRMQQLGFEPKLAADTKRLLDACDAARYGAGGDHSPLARLAEATVPPLLKAAGTIAGRAP